MFALIHPLQYISAKDLDRRLRRSRRHCQHWRQNHHQSPFADDINGLAGEGEKLANLVECLDKVSTAYGMEICAENSKLITSNTSDINTEIKVNWQKLETVTSFKYLSSVLTDEGSKPEILSRIAQTAADWQGWNQFGMTGVFLSVPKHDRCAPLSHPSACVLVNLGPSQHSSKEEYKP